MSVLNNRKLSMFICIGIIVFVYIFDAYRESQLMPTIGNDDGGQGSMIKTTKTTPTNVTKIQSKTLIPTNETTTITNETTIKINQDHIQHDESNNDKNNNSTITKASSLPTQSRTNAPSMLPSSSPSALPSSKPSILPSSKPSTLPSTTPSPSSSPSSTPSNSPIEFMEGVEKILRDHPHRGATDEYGRYGYIANVTNLRQWMLQKYCTLLSSFDNKTVVTADPTTTIIPNNEMNNNNTILSCKIPFANNGEMSVTCDTDIKKGIEGEGWDIMKDIIHVPIQDSILLIDSNAPKILCSIYTYEKKEYLIRAISETWGWRCNGFFASSTKTTTKFNNISDQVKHTGQLVDENYIPPPTEMINLLHEGVEGYHNMWQKTRSMLTYMYDHYLNDYDYFYLCGDDTHLIVENLKRFLIQYEHNKTLVIMNQHGTLLSQPEVVFFTGQIIKTGRVYMGGGGGYVISRLALKRFVEDAIPNCNPHHIVSAEDRFVSNCFTDYLKVTFIDAADDNGKQRFHGTSPHWLATGRSESGFFVSTKAYWTSIHGNKSRAELVSPSSISFHYMKNTEMMKRHHIILYYNGNHSHYHYDQMNPNETGACPIDSVLYKALSSSSVLDQ